MTLLETSFFSNSLKNPLFLASGIQGVTRASLENVCKKGAGGVISKSLTQEARKGHETPIMVETHGGFLNAVGYSNPGIDAGLTEFSGWKRNESFVLSITAKSVEEYGRLAETISHCMNEGFRCTAIEAVLSCPHTPEYGLMAGQQTPETAREVVRTIKSRLSIPLIIKISPGIPGEVEVACAAESAGADALDIGNTLGPGMKIDIDRAKPVLGFGRGGLSGPAIKPIAIRTVYDVYKSVKIPIIGCGGITYGADAIEYLMAGASFLGVGTALYYRGTGAFHMISREMESWLSKHGYSSIKDVIGLAHR